MIEKAPRLLRSRLVLVLLVGSSCGPANEVAPAPATPSAAAATPEAPQHGVDLPGMDTAVAPGADFFAYANGTWTKQTDIPPDRSNWGVGSELMEATTRKVRALLEDTIKSPGAPGSETRKVADYYSSFMDEAAIEARGTAPLTPVLARIAGLKDKGDLARELGGSLRADVDPLNSTNFHTDRLFGLFVSGGFSAPERNVPYLLQGGLGLPDRDFYVNGDARMQGIREQYRAHVSAIFRLAGIPDPDTKAAGVLALETKIAAVHVTREGSSQVLDANNPWHRSEFTARAPGLDWARFFQAAGLDREGLFIVWQPSAITGTAQLVRSEPLSVWKDWLTFHAIDRKSRLLPRAFVAEDFAFYGHAMRGTPQLEERWKRGIASTNAALADAVGKLYVERHFSPEAKAALQAMVQTIVDAFRARVQALEWMAPATRARALAKLSTLYVGVGYPDRWLDYSELEVVPGDVVGNAERAELARYRRSLAKLGQPMDKAEWWMMVQLVNAVNLPLQNALNFPAAILAPPFFDPEAPAAVNYGAIGAVIGHEISHSFDDQGAQFDENGKLTDWWTKADREHFDASGASLVTQYDAYEPLPGVHVNGHLTLGENIADLAGLAAAHDGWLASLKGQPAPVVQGLSGEQQFFIAFAQAWRGKEREPALRQQLIVDGHAPEKYRAATVRNLDAWYEAFGVQPGQALYLEPKDRVRVW
jgi:putative endopeptidase